MVQVAEPIASHVYAGCTFPGRRGIGEVLNELERQKEARQDYVLDSAKLKMRNCDGQLLLVVPGKNKGTQLVPLSRRAHIQLANRMGIPIRSRFYNWLAHGKQNTKSKTIVDPKRNWDTWVNLVNAYLTTESAPWLVRLLTRPTGELYCRALLSNKYKIISNADFFYSIAEKLKEVGAEIWHARLSEDKFYGYAVAPHVSAEVTVDRSFDPGDGWRSRWVGDQGDTLNAALAFGNSETGEGGIFLTHAVLRRVCENYCAWHDIVAFTHIGERQAADSMLTDETIAKQNEVFFLKIRDYVTGSFDAKVFKEMISKLTEATTDEVQDPEKAAEALQVVYDLSETRKSKIRNLFIRGMDNSRYGLVQAMTRFAHEGEQNADKGFALEKLAKDLACSNMEWLYKKADRMTKKVAEDALV